MHIYIYMYIHIVHIYVYTYIYTYIHIYIYTSNPIDVDVCVCIHIYMSNPTYICVRVRHICIYTHAHVDPTFTAIGYSRLQIGWHRISRLCLKTFNIVPGILMGFIISTIYYLVLIVNPMDRILVNWILMGFIIRTIFIINIRHIISIQSASSGDSLI